MYVCIIRIEDSKAVAAIRAARRLPPEVWQVIRELLGEFPAASDDNSTYSFPHIDPWQWAPSDSAPPDLDDPASTGSQEAGEEETP